MNTMMTYINQQPEVLNKIASGVFLPQIKKELTKVIPEDKTNLRIVMVASGTSLNAARVAGRYFPCEVEYYYPYEFTAYNNLDSYNDNTVFILISQGGTSLSTYAALQHVKGKFKTLAVVGDVSKPIATEADAAIEFGCGPETVVYRTKGYTSSALMLCLIAAVLNESDEIFAYQYDVPGLPFFMERSVKFTEQHLEEMKDCSSWIIAGSGINNVTAVEGALKIIETVRVPSMSFDLEELIHGAQNAITGTTRIVIIENFDDEDDKAFNLFRALRLTGQKSYLIGTRERNEFNEFILTRPEYLLDEMTAIIPLQHISYLVSQARCVDLTKPGLSELSNYIAKSL
ncbi:SIS domain-containing protein [Salmonella enterica]|nr:SIS domain-containing protein [Salmonella enterica]